MLNGAHLHLLVNHVPELAAMFGVLILLGGLVTKRADLVRAALVLFIFGGIGAAMANFTGEDAEHIVTKYPGVYRTTIHAHEEAAETAWIAEAVLGVLALGALVRWRRADVLPTGVVAGFLVLGVGMSAWMAYVSHLGGHIRHAEIRELSEVVADSTADAQRRAERLRRQAEAEGRPVPGDVAVPDTSAADSLGAGLPAHPDTATAR